MNVNKLFSFVFAMAIAMVVVGSASAQADLGPQLNNISSSSQLNLSANAETALQIDISGTGVTGATGNSSTGVFSLNFGNVNGLGLGTPSTGVTVAVQAGGALYTAPVTLTPRYSGFTTSSSSVSVVLDSAAGNTSGNAGTREGATAATVVAPSSLIPNVFTTTASNGTAINRNVGMFVSNANGGGAVNGAMNSRLVYQITVP
jgi:hypothetical protein